MRAVSTAHFRTSEIYAFEKHVLRCALPHTPLPSPRLPYACAVGSSSNATGAARARRDSLEHGHAWDPVAQFLTLCITVLSVFARSCLIWIVLRWAVMLARVVSAPCGARVASGCRMSMMQQVFRVGGL